MTTEVGVPGKNLIYLNIHHEGTSEGEQCSVNERWTNALLDNQSEYLVAISRFEVPMNKVPITKKLDNAITIHRYHEGNYRNYVNGSEANAIPHYIRIDQHETLASMQNYTAIRDQTADTAEDRERQGLEYVAYNAANPNAKWVPVQGQKAHHGYDNFEVDIATAHEDEWKDGDKSDIVDTYLSNLERIPRLQIASIDMPPCHTLFEFINTINGKINDVLTAGEYKPRGPNTFVAYGNPAAGAEAVQPRMAVDRPTAMAAPQEETDASHRYNVYSEDGRGQNDKDPIAYFKIEMASDYKFSIIMNHHFSRHYYVKLNPELFKMMQFRENFTHGEWDRTYLTGMRFMGERMASTNIGDLTQLSTNYATTTPPHDPKTRYLDYKVYKVASAGGYGIATPQANAAITLGRSGVHESTTLNASLLEYCVYFTSPTSAADSFNRIKSIVFTSSLVTKSEGQSGNTYRRILTDFTVPVGSAFSWNPYSNESASITEGAAAELTFANNNPSSGRLLIMTDPSPLYELSLRVLAKCWNFDTESFSFEAIPLPQGSTFTCKLVFISKNDIYHDHEQRPDKLKG